MVGNASTEHSFSIWVSKELAIELAPSARVLVWFMTDNGEVITDSRVVPISDIFANEVSASPNKIISVTACVIVRYLVKIAKCYGV